MRHFDTFLHENKKRVQSQKMNGWCSSSRVILDELGAKLRNDYERFRENTDLFKFDMTRPAPPRLCQDAQCSYPSDSEESDFEGDADTKGVEPRTKRKKTSECEGIALRLYGNGYSNEFDGGLKVTEKLNFSRIFNLLSLLPYQIPGFHSSYIFYGTSKSIFPIHTEDGLTWSMNYLYVGSPKVW